MTTRRGGLFVATDDSTNVDPAPNDSVLGVPIGGMDPLQLPPDSAGWGANLIGEHIRVTEQIALTGLGFLFYNPSTAGAWAGDITLGIADYDLAGDSVVNIGSLAEVTFHVDDMAALPQFAPSLSTSFLYASSLFDHGQLLTLDTGTDYWFYGYSTGTGTRLGEGGDGPDKAAPTALCSWTPSSRYQGTTQAFEPYTGNGSDNVANQVYVQRDDSGNTRHISLLLYGHAGASAWNALIPATS